MSVTNSTVIRKIIKEAEQAKEKQTDDKQMLKHIANVKLLCELLLEEEGPLQANSNEITADEIRTMMGTTNHQLVEQQQPNHSKNDHDDANGESIFDF
ncbi:hypothetical protein GCM10011409_10630 [Lentibacillus populi]|uniref:YwdI family protein n=1 Tax=Lentibacillus populi TaxID=1827502 RepID=A0A9W5X4G4_9BACI|nr:MULTISPECIES: DUF5327 family protein [Bacillaceae]GGB35031.1 hypothetical protein GCM10011409_10630 [Lentibacillus populi]